MSYPEATETVRAAQRAEALAGVVLDRLRALIAESAQRGADTSGLEGAALLAEMLGEATSATVARAERAAA